MTDIRKFSIAGAIIVMVLCFVAYIVGMNENKVLGSAPPGAPAQVATTSRAAVTNSASLLFATSSCASRIISTGASAVMLGFSDAQGFAPTGELGLVQLASTTVAYDSGLYGCDAVRIFSYAAQTVTVTESR